MGLMDLDWTPNGFDATDTVIGAWLTSRPLQCTRVDFSLPSCSALSVLQGRDGCRDTGLLVVSREAVVVVGRGRSIKMLSYSNFVGSVSGDRPAWFHVSLDTLTRSPKSSINFGAQGKRAINNAKQYASF